MKIGIRGHDFGRHNVSELISLYEKHRIETVQLAIPKAVTGVKSYHGIDDSLLQELRDALLKANISVAVLGCYIDPALEDEDERKREIQTFRQGIRCAAHLGAGCIGTETTMFNDDESKRQKAFDRLSSSLEEMLKYAQEAKVTVAVEPVHFHTMNSPEMTAKLLERFSGAPLAAIFDPVNLLKPDEIQAQQTLWRECIDAFGSKTLALHVKDVCLQNEKLEPCLLGDGEMRYEPVIAPWLRAEKPDMPLLREEACLDTINLELDWMTQRFAIDKKNK